MYVQDIIYNMYMYEHNIIIININLLLYWGSGEV